jgi:hypothetical protein
MRTQHSQHRSKLQKIAYLFTLVIALAIVTPVLADYLGPDRTRTEQHTSCDIILKKCEYVAAKNDYRYHQIDSWSCSNESKPWKSYPSQPSGCYEGSSDTYWEKDESVDNVSVTYPEATISGALQSCTGNNGWCTSAAQLSLSGVEPVSGYSILGIEGTRNNVTFACTGSTCNVPLLEGSNDFTFWALSSWADTSLMGTLSAKVDTVKPSVTSALTAITGLNGWYTSPVVVNSSASDATSGLLMFTCGMDGVGLSSCSSITINGEGRHSLILYAQDKAGLSNMPTRSISIDTKAPALNISLAGTNGSNPAWYTSARLNGSASDDPPGSGLSAFEYRFDQDSWSAFPSSGELPLPEGKHTVEVRATDNAGLTTSSQKTFSLDSVAPEITVDPAGTTGANNWYITNLGLSAVKPPMRPRD